MPNNPYYLLTNTNTNTLLLLLLLLSTSSTGFQLQTQLQSQSQSQTQSQSWQLPMTQTNTHPDYEHLRVMVNGMPGPMATEAAEACLRKGLSLAPIAFTGPNIEPCTIVVSDPDTNRSATVRLIPSSNADSSSSSAVVEMECALEGLRAGVGSKGRVIAIDYTHPSAVNSNGEWYVKQRLPFVMGTTGGDREALEKVVMDGKLAAVIAPNMGKQIVAMQAALEMLAKQYPLAFSGYSLTMTESHQKTKADTSGTAKAVVGSLLTLSGDDFDVESDINMLRDDESSMAFGVKEDALNGHAFHTYTLTSGDGSVEFELKHNVSGRRIYAEGTADAVMYLSRILESGGENKIYTMINVLEEGALE